jgi:hypothetical protein
LSGAALAFFFFWRDLHGTLTKVNEAAIGVVHYKYRIAQRRFHDRLVWDMLKQDSPVYSGDVLHTASLGEASITFQNGETVYLGENSLAQIFYSESGTRIELSSGSINVDAGPAGATLHLVSGGTEIQIAAGSTVSANAQMSGGAAVQIAQGSAEIITKDGVHEAAGAGAALALGRDGQAVQVPAVTLISPAQNKQLVSADGGEIPVDFVWGTHNFAANDLVRFEVASDRRFSRLIAGAGVRDTDRQTVRLGPGSYWWRAFPAQGSPETAGVGAGADALVNKLVIVAAVKPELLQPAAGATFSYRSKAPQIRFQWRGASAGASGGASGEDAAGGEWLLVVADNDAFINPLLTQTVRGQNFITSNLEAGRYFWRVEPVYSGAEAQAASFVNTSASRVFSIEQNYAEARPVELSLPVSGAFVNIAPSADRVNFIWKNEPEAYVYRFSIARDTGFTDTVLTRETRENRVVFNPAETHLAAGVYFWRVSWIDNTGTQAPASAARQFNAMEGSVVFENVNPQDNWTGGAPALEQIRFTWRTNLGGAGRLQVAQDSAFSSIVAELPAEGGGSTAFGVNRVEGASGLRLGTGNYYWRVWTAGGDTAVPFQTTARHFEVRSAVRVTLSAPANGAVLDGLEALRKPPVLLWSSEDPLVRSRILLSRSPNPQEGTPILDIVNPGRNVPAPPLEAGVYYWTVQAESAGNFDVSAARPYSFTVRPIPPLDQAVPASPADNVQIGAAELRQNRRIDLSWNAARGANAYQVTIYRQADRARQNPLFVSEILRTTRYSFTNLAALDNGAFIWQVEALAVNGDGRVEQRGMPASRRFVINISIPQSKQLPDEETYGL